MLFQRSFSIATVVVSLLGSLAGLSQAEDVENVKLQTRDGVQLVASYFPSDEKKKATPVVILHDYKESRAAYTKIARELQKPSGDGLKSLAVMTIDLRGHGESTKQTLRNGRTIELDAAKLKKGDFEKMVLQDMEAVRKFLVTKNDEEEINLNKLSIVGVGTGASIGTLWSAKDWSTPPLAVVKQGQDVKALVLVSPRWKNRGLLMQKAIRQPGVRAEVALMMIYGSEDPKVRADVLRIKKQVEKYHPKPESRTGKPSDLAGLGVPKTALQGGQLLREVGGRAVPEIAKFLNLHVVEEEHDWIQRRNQY